jgi:hypothetical protein
VLLFRRGEMPSWRSPPSGEPLTVIVVVPRREEYHVVAAIEGHELETPEAEHRPGLKRLLKSTHLEPNGKVFVNTQQAPTWRTDYRGFGPGGSLDRPVNLSMRVPAQMGWCEIEHKWGNEPSIILHQGARSRGYKRCERARARERRGPTPARLLPSLCRASTRASVCSYACIFIFPLSPLCGALDTPFYRRKEMPNCTMGCSRGLTWLAGKCPKPCTDNNVAVEGASRAL